MPRPKPQLSIDEHVPEAPWDLEAACKVGTVTDLFFSEDFNDVHRAKQICHRCPVRRECLNHALVQMEPIGVWGGLDPQERRQLIKQQRKNEEPAMTVLPNYDQWLESPYTDSEAHDAPDDAQLAYDEYIRSLDADDEVVPIEEFLDDWYSDMEDEAMLRRAEERAEEAGSWRHVLR